MRQPKDLSLAEFLYVREQVSRKMDPTLWDIRLSESENLIKSGLVNLDKALEGYARDSE